MSPVDATARPSSNASAEEVTLRGVTVIAGVVIALTFIFGFGNVWTLALRLGVPAWVAPLVAPAVDLSILGLLLGTRHLALRGATVDQLRPARRLLLFSSVVTLALNISEPLIACELGKAAFDAVGPLLLIGWAEVGPGLLGAIGDVRRTTIYSAMTSAPREDVPPPVSAEDTVCRVAATSADENGAAAEREADDDASKVASVSAHDLLERARQADSQHWMQYQRPISAETLRKELRVGAARSRMLVAMVRSEQLGRQGDGRVS